MFTKQILDQAAALSPSELVSSSTPVAENEIVLGELPDDLKRLWVVMARMLDDTQRKTKELRTQYPLEALDDLDEAVLTKLSCTAMELDSKMKIVHTIFWTELRLAFPEVDGEKVGTSIGVRENFVAVSFMESGPLEQLAALLGGSANAMRI